MISIVECKVCHGLDWLVFVDDDSDVIKVMCSECGHVADDIGRFTHDIDNRKKVES